MSSNNLEKIEIDNTELLDTLGPTDEDDTLEEISEEEINLEKELDKESEEANAAPFEVNNSWKIDEPVNSGYNNNYNQVSNSWENSSSWSNNNSSWSNNNSSWENSNSWQQGSETSQFGNRSSWNSPSSSSWGNSNSTWSSPSFTNNQSSGWGQQNNSYGYSNGTYRSNNSYSNQQPVNGRRLDVRSLKKRAIIIDVLDCLYESLDANNRPDVLPRGIYDLRAKTRVWDKLSVFSAEKIYLVFPPKELVPSFGNENESSVALDYVTKSISTYLRIPKYNCSVLRPSSQTTNKTTVISSAVGDWVKTNHRNIDEIVYIGTHGGSYNLSARDLFIAKSLKVDFMNVYNLLENNYVLE